MSKFLNKVLLDNGFVNSKNEVIKFHSHTSKEQCDFLQQIIIDNKLNKSIEIGFAYGTSTLAITEAIKENGGNKHIVIDVYENKYWGGNGLELIEMAKLSDYIDFREDFCYKVLPQLLINDEKINFAYVDSTKQFDWIFCNFFYIDKLLTQGGIVVFDDVSWPGVRKVMRYINQLPNYEVYDCFPENIKSNSRELLSKVIRLIPGYKKIFSPELILTDYQQKLSSHCVAFRKTATDTRNWDWHLPF